MQPDLAAIRVPSSDIGMPVNKNHDVYFVPGLQRGLRMLEVIAEARQPLSAAEIARQIGVTRSSAFRLIYTLRHMGFLELARDGHSFTLGPRVLNIGFAYLASMDIIEVARPDLELLRDRSNVSAHLSIRDGSEMLYLICIQTRSGFLSTINVGARFPAYATPMGWLLLSDLSARELAALYGGTTMRPLTSQTPTDITSLVQRVGQAAIDGYVLSRAIIEPGGSSIAAPILDKTGKVVAAIDIAGPDSAFDLPRLDREYLTEVLGTARRISARLGYQAGLG
jgi:DNA-binding IclR family transcriptional regulator